MCLNVQGLINNLDELKYVIRKQKPDICLLNETHTTNMIDDGEIKIGNYYLVRCDSHSNRTGGVVAYISNKIKCNNVKRSESEIAWFLTFEIKMHADPVTVAGVYLSSSENKTNILNILENWCDEICDSRSVIIAGDFNINMTKNAIDVDNGLNQRVKNVTRVSETSATLIDLCLTNMREVTCTVMHDDQISDHYCLEIMLKGNYNNNVRIETKTKYVNSWKNYSKEKLCDEIKKWCYE